MRYRDGIDLIGRIDFLRQEQRYPNYYLQADIHGYHDFKRPD